MPAEVSPMSEKSWAVAVTYEPDGYVSDKDAEKINYTELLTQMKKSLSSANEERQKAAYEPVHLVGWAKAPHYDSQTHKQYWAKQLKFGSQPENTLNYNIRMLGRGRSARAQRRRRNVAAIGDRASYALDSGSD
jgi:uncharacterized membrane-anchored protein